MAGEQSQDKTEQPTGKKAAAEAIEDFDLMPEVEFEEDEDEVKFYFNLVIIVVLKLYSSISNFTILNCLQSRYCSINGKSGA